MHERIVERGVNVRDAEHNVRRRVDILQVRRFLRRVSGEMEAAGKMLGVRTAILFLREKDQEERRSLL